MTLSQTILAAAFLWFALLLAACAPAPRPTPEPMPVCDADDGTDCGERPCVIRIVRDGTTDMAPGWLNTTDGGYYDISGTSMVYVASKERPIARFHYEGGAWCNVYADDKGIHWEECK